MAAVIADITNNHYPSKKLLISKYFPAIYFQMMRIMVQYVRWAYWKHHAKRKLDAEIRDY